VKTSQREKEALDHQCARFVFATNSAFRHVEHPEFIRLMALARPGYNPPNRHQVGGPLLDDVYNSITSDVKKALLNASVCMSIDGWSNIHNDPIICASVTDVKDGRGSVYLVDTVNTESERHTSEYLLQLANEAIRKCKTDFGCKVRSFVTDNATNMAKMRSELAKLDDNPDIITYGCSSHILNLLAHDIEIPGVKEHVVQIMKYFRNNHFAGAKYKEAGGKALILPSDVRWNTLADCLECYIRNWPVLVKVCTENRAAIDKNVASKVNDIAIKNNAADYLAYLKDIAVSLDKVQSNNCLISESTQIWFDLLESLAKYENELISAKAKSRFEMAMTAPHYLANLLDPRYRGLKLTQEQIHEALQYASAYHPDVMPAILKYRAEAGPFHSYMFLENILKDVSPLQWWNSLKGQGDLNPSVLGLVAQLFTAVASSAGLERLFSAFGLTHTKIRNRLGTAKAAKLVAILKVLNMNYDYQRIDSQDL
jgi:Protein of unknown function (DUF 659)/hAT family C-terminal dimerisation region